MTSTEAEPTEVAEQRGDGSFSVYSAGSNQHDGKRFAQWLSEDIAPVENPIYLLVYESWCQRIFGLRTSYVVPQAFGSHKKDAMAFHKHWKNEVHRAKLVFTRNTEGRALLTNARFAHLRYAFEEVGKRTLTWK